MRFIPFTTVLLAILAVTFCLAPQLATAQGERDEDDRRARSQHRSDWNRDFDDDRGISDQRRVDVDGWRRYRNWSDNDHGVTYRYRYPSYQRGYYHPYGYQGYRNYRGYSPYRYGRYRGHSPYFGGYYTNGWWNWSW